ncbi:MAG: transcription termination/antitermination NusG family protein, partial [Erysipelotrichaceae bacterium]|nr:transcription termination/antitermination NusG family protein [Erysipelotrichaceae bacterium]
MSDEKKVNPVIDDENEKRWYVVNTYSGHENRVKDNLEKRVESLGIQDSLFRVLVAEEP